MAERTKVMRGLECCSKQRGGPELCEQCPYFNEPFPCSNALLQDALTLLKEQEPRVMTLEEIRERAETADPDPVFVERKSGATAWNLYTIDITYHMAKRPYMGIRVWSSRPTDEQRRNEPWQ